MKDVSFDDTETWDKYLDQMTVEELASQISDMFGTPEVSSVAKPAFSEGDGTASVGANTFPKNTATPAMSACIPVLLWRPACGTATA